MRNVTLALLMLSIAPFLKAQKLLKPGEFLGYELGDRFTRHHRMLDYFRHVAEIVPNVKLVQYGETYEHRPLVYAIITSPENFKNLESIRLDNLRRAGLVEGTPTGEKKAIVWMSYNVHGNEASSLEASMLTLYDLADVNNEDTQKWLENTIVIMDPCINPDGRERYVNFYSQNFSIPPNPNSDANEHWEPWPGGRANHYLFDLNRDWAWETQVESQQRLKIYHQWMPHVHVDFHEQGYNSPYYFAPAAEPFHEVISAWQREFQTMIGKNNAKYFDEKGWLYFTKERFDLFYPSYGDTYPTYNGAIGMTYEQGGSGSGGITITTKEGDPLTLKDRLAHHHTSGLATVEITSANAIRVVDEFAKFFQENTTTPASTYKTYVIKGTNNPDKVSSLTTWMDTHAIRYGHPGLSKSMRGYDYASQQITTFTLSPEDLIISAFQPSSRFLTTVFEPQSRLVDSLTYDITTWNLIYALGLKAYALTERINVGKVFQPSVVDNTSVVDKPYAYIFKYKSLTDVRFLASLMQNGLKARTSKKSFTVEGQNFDAGTLLVTRRNNEGVKDFDLTVKRLANEMGRKIFTTSTGFVDKGKDFGSGDVTYLKAPEVAVLMGEQTSSLSVGEIWHFFEQQIHYPITQLSTEYFKSIDLATYDVLIIPEGHYTLFDDETRETLAEWVSAGGRLIILANGLKAFSEEEGFALKEYSNEKEKTEAERKDKELVEKDILMKYQDAERKLISAAISGAIYRVSLDTSHPLAFGLDDPYYSLKTNELHYSYLENGWNVGIIKGKTKPIQGFAGARINNKLTNSLLFGVEEKGRGAIVYMVDNPLFRCFWENGKMLFANAVFLVGQ